MLSHFSTRSHSSVAKTRLFVCFPSDKSEDGLKQVQEYRFSWKFRIRINHLKKQTWPICFMKSIITGRVPIPVDQTTIPYGIETFWPVALSLVDISLSETFVTSDPVFKSIPSLWNFSSAKTVILLSNLQRFKNSQSANYFSNRRRNNTT